jgi:hypothetical protein
MLYYAHYDGYADPETGGGFANTKTLAVFKSRKARAQANMRFTPVTRREAIRFYGLRRVSEVQDYNQ